MTTSRDIPRPSDPRNRFDLLDSAVLCDVGIFGFSVMIALGSRAAVLWGFNKITAPIAKKKVVNPTCPNIWCS